MVDTSLRIAMIGTRGVPANYGGFETAVEEIGARLVESGHRVVVYTRDPDGTAPRWHRGMRVVVLPAIRRKTAETLSHTALSTAHAVLRAKPDVAFLFNAANSPFLPFLRAARIPVATHVDGLEWMRAKWGRTGRNYYRLAESLAVRLSDALIADAAGISSYYRREFGVTTEQIAYGTDILRQIGSERLPSPLVPLGYHLVVARFEPENHVLEIVRGYHESQAARPLVVVGSAPFAASYTQEIERIASADDRITLLGGVYDQDVLNQLYGNALTYLHGHSVGGTNPSLLRAMGAGTAVIAWDVDFNREVAVDTGRYFSDPAGLGPQLLAAESDIAATQTRGAAAQHRASTSYRWANVAAAYAELATALTRGYRRAGPRTGIRIEKSKQGL